MTWFVSLHPVWQALLATGFTYAVTALGAACVFVTPTSGRRQMSFTMGFAGGVMIAASFWSLLSPAIDLCRNLEQNPWLIPALGFAAGGGFILFSDYLLTSLPALSAAPDTARKNILMAGAMALHNIPEGLAVGVAFGCAGLLIPGTGVADACLLALGIGLQNFPEGSCISLPLHAQGMKKERAFFYGQLTAAVEPIAGVAGAMFALTAQSALPVALSFSAGAMVSVVCSELIPDSFTQNKQLASIGVVLGFVTMMVLDVALG